MFAFLLAVASAASALPAHAPTPPSRPTDDWAVAAERCGVLAKVDGDYETRVLPGFSVIESTAGAREFALPADTPPNVVAVQCGRDSVVPRNNDYKVLGAGYPFIIIVEQGDRMLTMEFTHEKKLHVNVTRGAVSADEQAQIDAAVARAQKKIDAIRVSQGSGK